MTLDASDVAAARRRLTPYLRPSPLERAPQFGKAAYLKLENMNPTRSFKVRGALNAVLALDEETRARGVIAASSGNHAQGIAYATSLLDIPARVLMPRTAPQRKVQAVQQMGAAVDTDFPTFDAAEAAAIQAAEEEGLTYISPYNDEAVIAGQGTIGLEVLDALDSLYGKPVKNPRLLVCVGGGGLLSGIALVVHTVRPQAAVIGVCAEGAPALYNVYHDEDLPEKPTIADALVGGVDPESRTITLVRQFADGMRKVTEAEIMDAMRWCVFQAGLVVEGGGAVALAALIQEERFHDSRPTVAIVSGGNIDADRLKRVLCGGSG